MAGRKTREQQIRTLERKDGYPDGVREDDTTQRLMETATSEGARHREALQSQSRVSRKGLNQESTHNKHDDGGQKSHKPQQHDEAEEGH